MPESEPKIPTLAQKILEIQGKVGVVKKKGRNVDQKYDYLRIEDTVVAVNTLLKDAGLLLTATLQKKPDGLFHLEASKPGEKGHVVTMVLDWTLEDVVTKETRHYDIPGAGWDYNDKAVPKAITSSRKQAIILIFNLPVGNDIEERGHIDTDDAKRKQRQIAEDKVAAFEKSRQDPESQERAVLIGRPPEHEGRYIIVSGFIQEPKMAQFFSDCNAKGFVAKKGGFPYYRLPSEHEKDLLKICRQMEIEVKS